MLLPGWGLLFFALGFGLGHIGYGLLMYNRYERPGAAGASAQSCCPVKHLIHTLNKAFDHRVRLGVMAVLLANESVSFNDLKEVLDLTDGNLASHVAALEKAEYVLVSKQFIGKKPNTTYTATAAGKAAFQQHLAALEKLLRARRFYWTADTP